MDNTNRIGYRSYFGGLFIRLLECSSPLSLTALVIIIPLIVLVGVREVSKSNIYDMWEIEQSSRCQLVKITACRMLIIGLADLFLITSVLVITSFYYQQSILEIILYGMVPFNISCTCYLFTIIKMKRGKLLIIYLYV